MSAPHLTAPLSEDITVQRTHNHFRAELEGDSVIMSIEAGKFFTFDAIGFEIWNAFETRRRVGEVIDELAARHHAPRDTVRDDVMAFLSHLANESLLEIG